MTDHPESWRSDGHVIHFRGPYRVFEKGEARRFEFGMHIDMELIWTTRPTSACMIGHPRKGCVQGHVTSLKYEKLHVRLISHNQYKIKTR